MSLFKSLSTNQRSEKIKGSSVTSYGTTSIQRGEPSDKLEKSVCLLSSHVFQCVKEKQSLMYWGFLSEQSFQGLQVRLFRGGQSQARKGTEAPF